MGKRSVFWYISFSVVYCWFFIYFDICQTCRLFCSLCTFGS